MTGWVGKAASAECSTTVTLTQPDGKGDAMVKVGRKCKFHVYLCCGRIFTWVLICCCRWGLGEAEKGRGGGQKFPRPVIEVTPLL
jgi:hypothetical protein